jgi:hypothetical protein
MLFVFRPSEPGMCFVQKVFASPKSVLMFIKGSAEIPKPFNKCIFLNGIGRLVSLRKMVFYAKEVKFECTRTLQLESSARGRPRIHKSDITKVESFILEFPSPRELPALGRNNTHRGYGGDTACETEE